MNRQCLWFVVKEGVCRERGTDIHDEVVYGTVSGMHDVGLVLQQVIDALNNASLAEHDFVPHGHEPVLCLLNEGFSHIQMRNYCKTRP